MRKNQAHYQLAVLSILLLASPATARDKDLTAPILTCGVIGQLVQDAAISLGPIRQADTQVASQLPSATQGRPGPQAGVKPASPHAHAAKQQNKQQAFHNRVFEPQAYRFSGEQMWGKANVTLVTAARSFDVKVQSTLPVSMWALYADDAQIASASVPNLTTFSFKGNELYTPPYKLVLNVMYMGIPNQIRVEIK
jgi:hypothetical protein